MNTQIERLYNNIKDYGDSIYLFDGDNRYSYTGLIYAVSKHERILIENGVITGDVIALIGEFNNSSISLLLALLDMGCIVMPVSSDDTKSALIATQVEKVINASTLKVNDFIGVRKDKHELYKSLIEKGHGGIVLMSSGSSGIPKVVVHDAEDFLGKYTYSKSLKTVGFLLFDHIGGLNTLFYTLFGGGSLVTIPNHKVSTVLKAVNQHNIELLPTTPTFIHIMLLSGACKNYDLSSLKYVSYGTEPMPQHVLDRLSEELPEAEIKQTYGLSETGILSTKSKERNSLLLKLKPDEYRIKDNILWLKTKTSMVGYLNAESPIDEDGFFNTQDRVHVEGDYIRILGKESDSINVGGIKVAPIEVESVIMSHPDVKDCVAYGEPNSLMGSVVCAKVVGEVDLLSIRDYCKGKLNRYTIPTKIRIVDVINHTERFKKVRKG